MRFASYTDRMRARSHLVDGVRAFFTGRGFLEVDTPVAITAPAPELHIEAPAVTVTTPAGPARRFLQPSPELPMKRLLATGLSRIFQIAPVFRDGEVTPIHRPEFRLLEWYRKDADWTELMVDCEELLRFCAQTLGLSQSFSYQGRTVDLRPPFIRLTVEEAFRRYAGFSILAQTTIRDLRARLVGMGLFTADDDSWDDLFHRVYLTRVEPMLKKEAFPVLLTHYPAPLAALARLCPGDPAVAERFELFAGGLELANAYGELVDADEQRRRFIAEAEKRIAAGRQAYPVDERFLASLDQINRAAGIALGLDRLLMLFLDAADIDDVQFLPWHQT